MSFILSFQSEWLKTKRSVVNWLTVIGGFFLPVMYILGFAKDHTSINSYPAGVNVWEQYFFSIWKFMAVFILPMSVVLISTLIMQVEYKNNTWKVLITTPQKFSAIFIPKFLTVIVIVLKLFLYFNIGMLASGALSTLMIANTLPKNSLPVSFLLLKNFQLFITCLPVIAFQLLISLHFKNYFIPIGVGFLALIGSFIGIKVWSFAFLSPFSYTPMLIAGDLRVSRINVYILSMIYFVIFSVAGYLLFTKREVKG